MDKLYVEVAYYQEGQGHLLGTLVDPGQSVQVLLRSLGLYEEVQADDFSVGIWGKAADGSDLLKMNDRVELYPKLKVDPKTRRRILAEKQKGG